MKFTKTQWMTAGLGVVLMCLMMIAINKIDAVEDAAEKIGIVK